MSTPIFANSAGWNENEQTWIARYAPFVAWPARRGRRSSPIEAAGHQQRGRDEAEELAVACRHQGVSDLSSDLMRSAASPRERSWWSSTRLRRAAGTESAGTPDT